MSYSKQINNTKGRRLQQHPQRFCQDQSFKRKDKTLNYTSLGYS